MDDRVTVSGFLKNGKLAYEQVFSTHSWYDEGHSIVDDDKFRVFYKIAKVEVRQSDPETGDSILWEMEYTEDGKIAVAWKTTGGKREQLPWPVPPPTI